MRRRASSGVCLFLFAMRDLLYTFSHQVSLLCHLGRYMRRNHVFVFYKNIDFQVANAYLIQSRCVIIGYFVTQPGVK